MLEQNFLRLFSFVQPKKNFWFQQIIIANDGAWGLCYEHSTSEGIAVVLLLEKIMNQIDNADAADESQAQQHLPPPERLEWDIAPEISQRMFLAAKSVDKRIADLDFFVYRYRGYGKSFIKSCKVSPDAYIQLALQLAYYKWIHGIYCCCHIRMNVFFLLFAGFMDIWFLLTRARQHDDSFM